MKRPAFWTLYKYNQFFFSIGFFCSTLCGKLCCENSIEFHDMDLPLFAYPFYFELFPAFGY